MIQKARGIEKIKQLLANGFLLSKLQWFLVVFFSTIIYLSLGLLSNQSAVYRATIEPAENSNGIVKVVFFGDRYKEYLASGGLHIPESGWRVSTASDSTTLTAEEYAPPLAIYSEGETIEVGLLHYANAGIVRLADGKNSTVELISLQSGSESVSTLKIGGSASDVRSFENKQISFFALTGVFTSILVVLTLIAGMQSRGGDKQSNQTIRLGWREVACFALPLLASTTIVLLTFWPSNVAYDGSLQWYQAATRGYLDAPLGITATLLLRLFTDLSPSPALVIAVQTLLSALGVALVLKELCHRGVPIWAAQFCSLVIAILPQYSLFFTNLGKDALSTIGILFLAWAVLSTTRNIKMGECNYFVLVVLIAAATLAGVIRINILPTVVFMVLVLGVFLFFHEQQPIAFAVVTIFLLAVIFIPKISLLLSDEQRLSDKSYPSKLAINNQQSPHGDKNLPLGLSSNFYIYHLFSAAVHSGIQLQKSDEEFFYRIAPRTAWANYDCFMTDTTFIGVSKSMTLNQHQYHELLKEHQLDLALAVTNIIKRNPSVLIDRQVCITKILWSIGYGEKPFQGTATLGYDNVTDDFKLIAGENKSLVSEGIRAAIQKYVWWTEKQSNFWFFWKPALVFYLGLFCVLFRLTVQRDNGLLLMLSLPLTIIFVLALVIPFPAYRYAYPATLLMSLLCTLAFSSAKSYLPSSKHQCHQ